MQFPGFRRADMKPSWRPVSSHGVGFLGGRHASSSTGKNEVRGLTTAAGLWRGRLPSAWPAGIGYVEGTLLALVFVLTHLHRALAHRLIPANRISKTLRPLHRVSRSARAWKEFHQEAPSLGLAPTANLQLEARGEAGLGRDRPRGPRWSVPAYRASTARDGLHRGPSSRWEHR